MMVIHHDEYDEGPEEIEAVMRNVDVFCHVREYVPHIGPFSSAAHVLKNLLLRAISSVAGIFIMEVLQVVHTCTTRGAMSAHEAPNAYLYDMRYGRCCLSAADLQNGQGVGGTRMFSSSSPRYR